MEETSESYSPALVSNEKISYLNSDEEDGMLNADLSNFVLDSELSQSLNTKKQGRKHKFEYHRVAAQDL
jgi:hypothetical protein